MIIITSSRVDVVHGQKPQGHSSVDFGSMFAKEIKVISVLFIRQLSAISNPFDRSQTTLSFKFQDSQVVAILDVACPPWMRKSTNTTKHLKGQKGKGLSGRVYFNRIG